MVRLSRDQVLKDQRTSDPASVTSLTLTHKALSDVSCLSEFKNLERLDLAFNSLTSLEGLNSCVNLKWLSVVQNKLQSLKGIEALPNLTVLNAGKNKLKSIDEVKSVVSLRALILNDNDIVSVCKLDELKELNTLVLSRNPVREIGQSLTKAKSLTKLSMSHCQLQNIGSSLKACSELKELRLSHNEINTLPSELAYNKKLQNLDIGNNSITRWSDLKILSSLVDLRNLNLQGNPIADKDKLLKKMKKLLPNLQIFNSKPIDKSKNGGKTDNRFEDMLHFPTKEQKESGELDNATESYPETAETEGDKKRKREKVQQGENNDNNDRDVEKNPLKEKGKKSKEEKLNRKEAPVEDDTTAKKKSKVKEARKELDIIDSAETSFADFFANGAVERSEHLREDKIVDRSLASFVTTSTKNNRNKNRDPNLIAQLSAEVEIGLGGPSIWGDE
ncbi:unnamed protein product [Linum trigynum]|uniref:Protein phosphatase 1 regulatory subunit 7 n=1 Tax=Linum trigynum TaxID=586398 RepID=A0AAV2D4M7_9ROSI